MVLGLAASLLLVLSSLLRSGRSAPALLLRIAGVSLLALAAAGGVLQIHAWRHPAWDVLAWQPDRALGWKLVPSLRWPWAGNEGYAKDFNVVVQTNSLGFHDAERSFEKPPGVLRVVLLGDSMVEAAQVDFERTAGQQLERSLNEQGGTAKAERFEVINLGVSGYSLGQYLLAFEEYGARFDPDYVFVLIHPLVLKRTDHPQYKLLDDTGMRVRPVFRLEEQRLVRVPAADFELFVEDEEKTQESYGGKRIRRRSYSVLREAAEQMERLFRAIWRRSSADPSEGYPMELSDAELAVNLGILSELDRQTRELGARLVLVDAIAYKHRRSAELSPRIEAWARERGIDSVPLSDALAETNRSGVATRFAHDGHFNDAGNAVFGESMHRWLSRAVEPRREGSPAARGSPDAVVPVQDRDRTG